MLLKLAVICLATTSANVFGRPRTLAQKAKRLRVNDLVARYDSIQSPVEVVQVHTTENNDEQQMPGTVANIISKSS